MRRRRPQRADPSSAEVAHRMADAVTYLSKVAENAGMADVSEKLLAIRKHLVQAAALEASARRTKIG